MKKRKPIETSQQDIVSYWARHEDESGLAIDWSDAYKRCWRCGYQSRLERCHIVPDSLGGLDAPSNLVLLCRRCHGEAPNVADPHFMWIWLRATCVPFYDSYWSIRGYFEFEQMFGRRPFIGIGLDKSQADQVEELLWKEMQNATIHFGEGRMNPATLACIFAKVEETLTGNPPKLKCPEWGQQYTHQVIGLRIIPSNILEDEIS
ncbi:MAG: HNH endonuclease [Nostoc sp.]|uniref:HNH endonuclease n=1 Tax=Nostoc sp. TaxID=1180 RepID=UPI002FFA616C